MNELTGQTAIVTGASHGIGAGISRSLAAAGAKVAVNYRSDSTAADRVVADIVADGGTALAIQANVSDEADVTRLFHEVHETLGGVDIIVNNAGIWEFQPLADITIDQYRRHYDTNVLGTLLVSREFARQAIAGNGAIVNLTSVGIGPTAPGTVLYTGTKMAIVAITKVLAVELAPRGIRVNSVAAGLVDTHGTRESGFVGSDAAEQLVATIPAGRIGEPDDIASVVTFLASDGARYVTGETVFAAGGLQLI